MEVPAVLCHYLYLCAGCGHRYTVRRHLRREDDLAFLLNQGWETMTDPIYGDQLIFKNTDIADFNINSPSFSQDYNLSVSGGNEKGNYYAGL